MSSGRLLQPRPPWWVSSPSQRCCPWSSWVWSWWVCLWVGRFLLRWRRKLHTWKLGQPSRVPAILPQLRGRSWKHLEISVSLLQEWGWYVKWANFTNNIQTRNKYFFRGVPDSLRHFPDFHGPPSVLIWDERWTIQQRGTNWTLENMSSLPRYETDKKLYPF